MSLDSDRSLRVAHPGQAGSPAACNHLKRNCFREFQIALTLNFVRDRPMLNFDADRFLKIQTGAVALGPEIDAAAQRYAAEGIDSVFFLGTGGAAILMYPAATFLASH